MTNKVKKAQEEAEKVLLIQGTSTGSLHWLPVQYRINVNGYREQRMYKNLLKKNMQDTVNVMEIKRSVNTDVQILNRVMTRHLRDRECDLHLETQGTAGRLMSTLY